ncbi:MAG: hypothetical protein ACJ0SL_02850 [Candidatus Rariloculaceae bacterium]
MPSWRVWNDIDGWYTLMDRLEGKKQSREADTDVASVSEEDADVSRESVSAQEAPPESATVEG